MSEEQPKKLDIDSKDIMGENLQKLREMFPSVVKDGSVDVEALRNIIGDISEPNQEYYNFTWAGKSEAFKVIKEKTTATLKPMKSDDESVDFENTQNIFIEGDNLEVLKILQKTYHNSIKMIYIDPPYNKDKDFVYPDKWSEGLSSYLEYSKLVDEEGNITNSSAEDKSVKAGRKHSRWLTMMYPRLFLARNLLKDDGVIFISIDDDEVKNLRMICDEIFGEENFVGQITIQSNPRGSQASALLAEVHEYLLCYAKNTNDFSIRGYIKSGDETNDYNLEDNNGKKYRLLGLRQRGGAWRREDRPNMYYPIYVNPETEDVSLEKSDIYSKEALPKRPNGDESRWTWGKETFLKDSHKLIGKKVNREGNDDFWDIFRKDYLENENGEIKATKPKTIWDDKDINYQNGRTNIQELFKEADVFDFPKPLYLLKKIFTMFAMKDEIVLDFFAGSGTTANAVLNLNSEDSSNIKFISVQLPEHLDKKNQKHAINFLTDIKKPTNISEITKERIRRAGQKIKEENPDSNVDTGFKVFKLSESNFKQWDDTPKSKAELKLAFEEYKDNVKEGSSQIDMLYEVILAKGLSLNSKVTEKEVGGKSMFLVNSDGVELLACFEDEISEGALDAVIELRPIYFICLDSSFKSGSALKTNSVLRFRDADILFETV